MIDSDEEAQEWMAGLDSCDDVAMERLQRLSELLQQENLVQNLVSKGSLEEVWWRHIADSAQLLMHAPSELSPWLDLGTGAGFPGLVIAILRPNCRVLMVESRAKRVEWLSRVKTELGLDFAEVVGTRLELVEDQKFSVISARAFAPLGKLLELSSRFSTAETVWLLPKGRSASQELEELRGWRHTFHVKQSLTDPDSGIIVGSHGR